MERVVTRRATLRLVSSAALAAIAVSAIGYAQATGAPAADSTLVGAAGAARVAASRGPSGWYAATITKPASLRGSYRIAFSPGRFVVHAPYGINGQGTDSVSGSKMTVHGPGPCRQAGTYQFTLTSKWLTFRKLRDSCPRAAVLTASSWKKL
jgi:hypothetical protein